MLPHSTTLPTSTGHHICSAYAHLASSEDTDVLDIHGLFRSMHKGANESPPVPAPPSV